MDSSQAHLAPQQGSAETEREPLESAEEDHDHSRYCPIELLARFALLMAGHGRCVHVDVMLGDREYAMWELACARGFDDPELAGITSRLFAYFDDPQHSGMAVIGTA